MIDQSILNIVDKHAPEKTMRERNKKNQWITSDVLRLISLKNKFYKEVYKASKAPTDGQVQHYKKFRNYVTNQIRTTKKNYISKSLSANDKSIYSCLKSITKKQKSHTSIECLEYKSVEHTDEKDIACALNDFFINVAGHSEFNQFRQISRIFLQKQIL